MGSNGVASIGSAKVAVCVDLCVLNGSVDREVAEHLKEIRRGFTLIYSAQQRADYFRLQRSGIPKPHFLVAQGQADDGSGSVNER
ncbi:MAG: hypothetical protein HZA83_00810 [Thaumarchaeota archaeon]|nr:hypothetical protein [Nitrososphaerota archaeon]